MNSSELLSPTDPVAATPAARRSVRRRLIQSTLFPHKSPGIESNGVHCVDEECDEDNDSEDEERGGSQGKKKGTKRKGKGTPQKRASKKGKGKSPMNATPKKNVTGNGKSLNDLMEGERPTPPPMPNLRLEAKLTAEENSRIFNGKQMHPFFSSWKAGKRTQGMNEEGSNSCSIGKKERGSNIGPIHVFERIQDDGTALDWRGWRFSDKFATDTNGIPGLTFTSVMESSAQALTFDNFSSISHQFGASFLQKKEINKSISQDDFCGRSVASSSQLSEDHNEDETAFVPTKGTYLAKVEPEQTSRILDERLMHHNDSLGDLSNYILWTDKYQPNRAMEVCGNIESVRFMNEWLRLWHDRASQPIKASSVLNGGDLDEDYEYYGGESDSEDDDDDENRLKNVLLVTGPIGCGKSAAIYACAKEQGFEILESNTSEYRTGALIRQKFGEALESHCLSRSVENPLDRQSKNMMKSFAASVNGIAASKVDNEVIDLIPISDGEDSGDVMDTSGDLTCKEITAWPSQVKVKSLILFEDVDIGFPEDRGLVAAIQQIAETAKGPVILTSNSRIPVLPDNFDRLELFFTTPSPEDLLPCLKKVCAEEKAKVQPYVIEQLIKCCKGDIRKAIMHLQFWCHAKDVKERKTCVQLPFDIEAAHNVLPHVMPWGFPSKLSALIEEEVTKSLSKRTEFTLQEGIEEEGLDDGETIGSFGMHTHRKDSIAARKEEMLSRNFSVQDELLSPTDRVFEVSDSLGTPVSCSLLKRRRKLLIASSDSEDENLDRATCLVSGKGIDLELLPDNDGIGEAKKFEPTCLFSEVANQSLMDACKSADISEVPESSFVPETILEDGIELSSKTVSSGIAEIFVNNNLGNNQTGDATANFCKSSDHLVKSFDILSSPDIIEQSSHEDVNSQTENSEAVSIGHYVMDECSCMDFAGRSNYNKKLKYHVATDFAQESWKRLRENSDLKQYVCSERTGAFHIVRCTHKVSDLLSEIDLLLSKSQMLDSSEATVATCENSYGYGWCDEQMHMCNTTAQHGFCLYANNVAAIGSALESENQVDWAEQMLLSSSDTMALGTLLGRNDCAGGLSLKKCSGLRLPKNGLTPKSKIKSSVFDIMKSVLPSRSDSSLTSNACQEYMSSLRCISRAEASRLSCGTNKTSRRRGRSARHYLSTGAMMLSAEDISFLEQGELSGKITS